MKILKEFLFKTKGGNKLLQFGIPDNDQELEKMFKLRYEVYSKMGYISPEMFPEKIEKDEYDKEKKCEYFVAKIDDQIVGSGRLIQSYYLPTEKECFRFEEPREMKNIPRNRRGEIGRLIVARGNNNYIPPHLILLGILYSIMSFSFQKNLQFGYSFAKESLMKKMKKLGVPFHTIKPFTQVYSKKYLYGYFHDKKDPAFPVYYSRDEAKKYLSKIFDNNKIFKKIGKKRYLYLLGGDDWKFLFHVKMFKFFH